MSDLVKNIFRLTLFILVQVFVLNKIPHLHRFVVPYLYFQFILWLPFNTHRLALLAAGFLTGLALDYFTMTPGLHAAACVLIAYVRPFIIFLLVPKESSEFTYHEPSPRGMGFFPYFVYAFILTLLHHTFLTFLEWLQFGSFLDFLIKTASTTAISMLLILIVELMFPRKLKYRTNTA
ncbi:rod shape-determining protein MreD [Flaviaesturariibacter flavus]|uniref:Rod shape-determining protein MreD n=1 Tax=Flaviaesturariibacter flavus TaxID=2502780 RepID=A0A4R1BAS3_9BACT|nr:rod shape-determining protein MreD [Flaviaesturariibacter flavus]TCJ14059.1 rod shape-determining protein MreD [Flaviaesturariibacter flavus]